MAWPFAVVPPTSPSRVAYTRYELPPDTIAWGARPGGRSDAAPAAATVADRKAGLVCWVSARRLTRICTAVTASASTVGAFPTAVHHSVHRPAADWPRISVVRLVPAGVVASVRTTTRSVA